MATQAKVQAPAVLGSEANPISWEVLRGDRSDDLASAGIIPESLSVSEDGRLDMSALLAWKGPLVKERDEYRNGKATGRKEVVQSYQLADGWKSLAGEIAVRMPDGTVRWVTVCLSAYVGAFPATPEQVAAFQAKAKETKQGGRRTFRVG